MRVATAHRPRLLHARAFAGAAETGGARRTAGEGARFREARSLARGCPWMRTSTLAMWPSRGSWVSLERRAAAPCRAGIFRGRRLAGTSAAEPVDRGPNMRLGRIHVLDVGREWAKRVVRDDVYGLAAELIA
jgi:hypothetical protein